MVWRGLLGVVAAFLGAAPAAAASNLSTRAIISWQRWEDPYKTTEGLSQDYDLWFGRSVSESLRYKILLGAQLADNQFDATGTAESSEFRQYDARGDLVFALPKLQMQAIYEGFDTTYKNSQSIGRGLERGTARLNWQADHFPDLALWIDRRSSTDDLRGEEMINLSTGATLIQELGPWRLSGTVVSRNLDDQLGSIRESRSTQGEAFYQDMFYQGRLSTSARVVLADSTRTERGGLAGTSPGRQILIEQATTIVDPTPDDARDVVPGPAPALHDGQFSPAGLDLGPSGMTFLNVSMDLGRLVAVERLLLYVRDRSGDPVPTGGPLDWTVYVSDDDLDWARVPGFTVMRFDPARSLYEITLPATTTRLIKVVSFGVNIVETDLVEVEVFEEAVGGQWEEHEIEDQLGRLEGSVTLRPAEWADLSWTGRWNTSRSQPAGEPEQRTDDSYHYLAAVFDLVDWSEVAFRYQHREQEQSGSFDRKFDQFSTDFLFRPRPNLDLRITALSSTDEGRARQIETNGVALKTHVRLWKSLDLRLDLGEDWSTQRLPRMQEITRRYANFWLFTQLNEQVQLSAVLTASRALVETFTAAEDLARDDYRWYVEGTWRPGPPLRLTARMGSAGGSRMAADIRSYQIYWDPFQGGSFHLGVIYDEDVDTLADRRFRRLLVTPGWRLNRYTSLDLSYSRFDLNGATTESSESWLVNLTFFR